MTGNEAEASIPRRYVVTIDRGARFLPMGTLLEELRRFEGWDHHGCIDPIRSVVAEMLVLDGPRAGETVEVVLQSGYEYDPPFPFSGPDWLGVAGGDGRVASVPSGWPLGADIGTDSEPSRVAVTRPDVLVIDDTRTFRFPAAYGRTAEAGIALLEEHAWREVWLDYDLGHGADIGPVVTLLEDRAAAGQPFEVGLICVHTSSPEDGDRMVARLGRWYRVRRTLAHSFLDPVARAG